jgi:tRNA-specific 2-thiouridylase
VDDRPGDIVDSTGNILGKHKGISGYTVGQRRGLGISSRRPLYVVKIDRASRTIVVGTKEETFVSALVATDFNLLVDRPPAVDDRFLVKVRSTASAVPCRIVAWENDSLTLLFETPQSGVAPGQAAVLYSDDIVVGGGWIASQAGAIFQCGVSG